MRILVTGGMGFIGSHTCVELLKHGYDVTIVDNLSNSDLKVLKAIKELSKRDCRFYPIDIGDKEALNKVFAENDFAAVIHFAAYKAVGESVKIPLAYYRNNVTASLVLYETMAEFAVKTLVYSSSATVYGNDKPVPFKEEYGMGETTNPYGTTKKFNEQILADAAKADPALSVVLLRYFNPIGAHPSGLLGEVPHGIPNNLVPYIAKVATGELAYLRIYGADYKTKDGTGVRDYIHVVDLASAHLNALEYALKHHGAEAINVGSGCGYSVLEVLHAYEKACGKPLAYKILPRREGDIAVSIADCQKAKQLLGFSTKYSIEEMCRDSYNFMRKNALNKDRHE